APAGVSGRVVAASLNRSGRVGMPVNRSGYVSTSAGQRSGVVRAAPARGARVSGPVAAPGLRAVGEAAATKADPCAAAADFLRLDLLAPVGRVLDVARPPNPDGGLSVTVRTFGLVKLDWPRGEVVARTARYVAGVVFDHWVSPKFSRASALVQGWSGEMFTRL